MHKGAMFADMTTCNPVEIRKAAGLAANIGIDYVDVAIMGIVALAGIKTPLLCAGPSAAKVCAIFEKVGAPVRIVANGAAGDASTLKIIRSIFAKGLEALAIETLMAAEKVGVTEELYEVLTDIDENSLRSTLESFVKTHLIHAPRRLREIQEAERLLNEAGLPVAVLPGVRTLFERTCRYLKQDFVQEMPATAQVALDWLAMNAKRELQEERDEVLRTAEAVHLTASSGLLNKIGHS